MIHWTRIFAIVVLLLVVSCNASFILIRKSDNVRVDSDVKVVDSLRVRSRIEITPIKVK